MNLINNTHKELDYDNPDKIDIAFKCIVSCPDEGMKDEFARIFTTYYLMPGTNCLTLCKYNVDNVDSLSQRYHANIQVKGSLAGLLDQYPGSYITIENGTTK